MGTVFNMNSCLLVVFFTFFISINSMSVYSTSSAEDRTSLLNCFNTCSAAAFSSSTSCSFSYGFLVVLTYTNTCNNLFPLLSLNILQLQLWVSCGFDLH